ncbi:hypothetical protein D3C83_192840 [compost metagenome]
MPRLLASRPRICAMYFSASDGSGLKGSKRLTLFSSALVRQIFCAQIARPTKNRAAMAPT